jgi:hypothetical protein
LFNLQIAFNFFSGSLPAELCARTGLDWIDISANYFEGSISGCFNNSDVQIYRADSNFFTGPITFFDSGSSLIVLMLQNNMLSGPLPDMFGEMVNLVFLNLGYNNLSGPLPSSLSVLPQIGKIYLDHNNFSGSLPSISSPASCLSSLSCPWYFLQHLYLAHNRLTGLIPDSFHFLSSLSILVLNQNLLSGPFPRFGGNSMPVLSYLVLSDNMFAGPLTGDTLARLPSLDWLDVANNALTGPLPDTLPPGLFVLNFAANRFTGTIPRWAGLEDVRTISLARNQLFQEGHLEVALGSTQYLDLSGNPFAFQPLAPGFLTLSEDSMLVDILFVDLRIDVCGGAATRKFALNSTRVLQCALRLCVMCCI